MSATTRASLLAFLAGVALGAVVANLAWLAS